MIAQALVLGFISTACLYAVGYTTFIMVEGWKSSNPFERLMRVSAFAIVLVVVIPVGFWMHGQLVEMRRINNEIIAIYQKIIDDTQKRIDQAERSRPAEPAPAVSKIATPAP